MITQAFGPEVDQIIRAAQRAFASAAPPSIQIGSTPFNLPKPFPSPIDWRDCTIYMLMLDRFNNPSLPPEGGAWNRQTTNRQGGTFKGVTAQLPYIKNLGANAIWITPVFKNPCENAGYSYYGYGAQDFLNLEKRFASDGTLDTAEKEYRELIDTAHGLGLFVIQDIVINHAARVFDYLINGAPQVQPAYMNAPLGQEPPIQWLNGFGSPRPDWQDGFPAGTVLSPDDAIWPVEFQDKVFFRRHGVLPSYTVGPLGFVEGDFNSMRQFIGEYDATPPSQAAYRVKYGQSPVLSILAKCFQYLIAKYDVDSFRIDTVKFVRQDIVENFCNAMREFGLTVGKKNFFTFGEINDPSEQVIDNFVGRHSTQVDSGGLDAALDFILAGTLPAVAKGLSPVENLRGMFQKRNDAEEQLISSHAEAGRFFVTFLDNHDDTERFYHPLAQQPQITLGLACLYALQGIPCLYCGTEQGLRGTVDAAGNPDIDNNPEAVREALWGKTPTAFDQTHPLYTNLQQIISVRNSYAALRYGRLYFREVSGDGTSFGHSRGNGGVISFSRVLCDFEVVTIANTNATQSFAGFVLVDVDLNRTPRTYNVVYSNFGTAGSGPVQIRTGQVVDGFQPRQSMNIACLYVVLNPMEVQILA
jgi:glycosidase